MPNKTPRPHQELLSRLGANVRRQRLKRGLTQEQLAELVEVNTSMIQQIEYGLTNVLATTAMRLQAALECDWRDLMPKVEIRRIAKRARQRG